MKRLNFLIFMMVLLSAAFGLNAKEMLTLEEAWNIALANNHDARVARNTAQISKNNLHPGNAGLLPRLDIISSANYEDNVFKTETGEIENKSTLANAQIQASYTLFDGFNNINTYKKLKVGKQLGSLVEKNSLEYVVTQVSQAYYAVARSTENLRISEAALNISRTRLERAENRAQYGQANTIAVLAAQVDFNSDSVSYMNAQYALAESKRNLNVLLNQEVNADFSVSPTTEFVSLSDAATLKAKAMEKNAGYLISQENVLDSELDLSISKSHFYPQLSLSSSYGYNQTQPDFDIMIDDPNKKFTAGVNLSLNLFNGFRNKIQKQNSKILLNNQKIERERAKLELAKNIENNWQAYQNSRRVLRLQEVNLESAELNFQRTSELYNLGQVTTTTFREAQLNLVQARNNIANAKYDAKLYEIELLRLSGQLISG